MDHHLVIALLIFGPKNLIDIRIAGDDAAEEEPESEEDKEIRELEAKLAAAKEAKASKDESPIDEQ